jgi:DNA-binding transcriptional regulator YiaG
MVRMSYRCEIYHDDRLYTVEVLDLETPRCEKCGAIVMIDAANRRISDALRRQIGLLLPEEIRQRREALELSPEELAQRLGIAAIDLAAWEAGDRLQPRSVNHLLDLFFTFPNVRRHLAAPLAAQPVSA